MGKSDLETYVAEQLKEGYSQKSIQQALERSGWSARDIASAFKNAGSSLLPTQSQVTQTFTEHAVVIVEPDGRSSLDKKKVKKPRSPSSPQLQRNPTHPSNRLASSRVISKADPHKAKRELDLDIRVWRVNFLSRVSLSALLFFGAYQCFKNLGWVNLFFQNLIGN